MYHPHLRFCFVFANLLRPCTNTSYNLCYQYHGGLVHLSPPDTHVLHDCLPHRRSQRRARGYRNPSSLTRRIHLQDSVNCTLGDSSQLFRILEECNHCSIFIIHLPCQSFFCIKALPLFLIITQPYFAPWPDEHTPRGR